MALHQFLIGHRGSLSWDASSSESVHKHASVEADFLQVQAYPWMKFVGK